MIDALSILLGMIVLVLMSSPICRELILTMTLFSFLLGPGLTLELGFSGLIIIG